MDPTPNHLASSDPTASSLLIEAKLQMPVPRPETIDRPALTERLAGEGDRRVVTLVAPAGYGKTTAVVGWLRSRLVDVAWLTCDADDHDPVRFLAHLLAAIARTAPGATGEAERALGAGASLHGEVMPLLGNGLFRQAGQRVVVVLDDVHLIESAASLRLIELLIELAPTVTVVLAGRRVPGLSLVRWVAAGEAVQLGVPALRFDGAETARFLNGSLELDLGVEDLALLAERIEGWPAGLSLVATSLRAGLSPTRLVHALAEASQNISRYLLEETLGVLDERTLEFMVRSSVLGRVNTDVCEAALAEPDAGELIDEIRSSNLLIAEFDDYGQWFRYHQLLAEVLRERLRRSQPELIPELHRRASEWFESAGHPAEAIEHALDGDDGERAARLLTYAWLTMLHARRGATVDRILARLPAQLGPYGPAVDGIALVRRSLTDGTADIWEATAGFERIEREQGPPGLSLAIDAGLLTPFHGDVGKAVARGPGAVRRAADGPPIDRYAITVQYAAMLWLAGERTAARARLREAPPVPGSVVTDIWRLWALSGLALDDGDIDAALRHGDAAVTAVRTSGTRAVNACGPALQAHAWALLAAGQTDAAARSLQWAETVVCAERDPMHHLPNLIIRAQLHLDRQERSKAREAADAARLLADRFADVGIYRTRLHSVQARLRDEDASGSRANGVLATAATSGDVPTPAELRVLELLDGDLSVAQIANALHVSVNTVRSHRRRLYRRLGVASRSDAIRVARERGLR